MEKINAQQQLFLPNTLNFFKNITLGCNSTTLSNNSLFYFIKDCKQ